MYKIALVLLNYNNKDYIKDLFESISKLDFNVQNCDIFFVDNNSNDKSFETAKKLSQNLPFNVVFIKNNKNLGFAAGNNSALKRIIKSNVYKYAVLLNLDTQVDKRWLAELVKKADSDPKIGALQSLILMDDKETINTYGNILHYLGFGWTGGFGEYYKNIDFNHLEKKEIGYASGASVLYRVDALKKAGIFEEVFFMYHEDLELSWRIRMCGYKILTSTKSIVYHKYKFLKHKNKWFWTERNRIITVLMLYKLRTILVFSPAFLVTEVCVLFYSLKNRWFMSKIKSYLEIIYLLPYVFKKRKNISFIRRVDDKDIIKHMGCVFNFKGVENRFFRFWNLFLKIYFDVAKNMIRW